MAFKYGGPDDGGFFSAKDILGWQLIEETDVVFSAGNVDARMIKDYPNPPHEAGESERQNLEKRLSLRKYLGMGAAVGMIAVGMAGVICEGFNQFGASLHL